MSSCLGLFIEDNIIKYAKVTKEHDNFKVETFGVKPYENLGNTIEQVIEETYSYKIPISVNLSDEMYNYFTMFTLLNKKDLQKAIDTEFGSFCSDKGYNDNVFETRYAVVPDAQDKEKLKVIHISSNKLELNKRIQELSNYRLTNVSPISMTIPNLVELQKKENVLIVNMEEKTTITTVVDKQIYNVDILDQGSAEVLSKINLKENSYAKAYEVCKNTTIYTAEGQELVEEQTENYLEDMMPTLYNIASQVKKIVNESLEKIEKIYITGTLSLINNVDLYFQEYIPEAKCEILKPFFTTNTKEISIKDYIEVNSPISLALQGLKVGIEGMNFKKETLVDKIPEFLKIDIDTEKTGKARRVISNFLTNDFNQKLDRTEKGLLRVLGAMLILVIVFCGFSFLINKQTDKKMEEVNSLIADTQTEISKVKTDDDTIKAKTNEYTKMIESLQNLNDRISDTNKTRNSIPNLLNQIMFVIPENVQIRSIENTTDRHVRIVARAEKYEQLGYLIAKIKADSILTNVISDSGVKDNNTVEVTIEGDLP